MVSPPKAEKVAHTDTYHGVEYEDPYHWLRQRDDENVLAYLRAENKYVAFKMKHTEKLQKRLYEEMVGRIKEDDLSVPVPKNGYLYYSRTEKGKNYSIYCRKKWNLYAR